MEPKKIKSALISVFHKDGLDNIVKKLDEQGVIIYSTGGTKTFIEGMDVPVNAVEDLTGYPSILDGRVKTLHPKVFGGILARRDKGHLDQLENYDIPEIDLVIVDLYPFEETVRQSNDENAIIEKIDIGGISLIRGAAKNFRDVLVVPSQAQYGALYALLKEKEGVSHLADRQRFASFAFHVSSHYDVAIFNWFNRTASIPSFKSSSLDSTQLRYGENPHQAGAFFGPLGDLLDQLNGKPLSYNNLVDIDAAMHLMNEFREDGPTFAILKHTNPCGVATRANDFDAWTAALAGDPVSAFGGILISNATITAKTAKAINEIFYEVLIAPDFTVEALELLSSKKKRIVLRLLDYPEPDRNYRSLLNGVIVQEPDRRMETAEQMECVTNIKPTESEWHDLVFANKVVKHLKSNAIALAKDQQLLGMGCGQTSRVDALKQAIDKARHYELELEGGVMASDAFFPFADSVEIAHNAGIRAVVQPGGSIRDKDSIKFCNDHDMAMALTGVRHFKH